jgi:cytochrome c
MEDATMKAMMMMVALAAAAFAVAGTASAQEALAKSSGCLTCHDVDAKKMGPSYKSVAAKYKGKADAEASLVTKITTANGHPAVKASPDDVKSLVKWVLAM